ncbi:MAG: hypothetical protein JNN07_10155 [Verrucomicrobiales bacterium]|nr:hypothetical protein [Verrucomicrobiales bacterium]
MKIKSLALLAFSVGGSLNAATLTVTTTDNENPAAGSLSLKQALEQAQNGDTVAFNIPGDGPHYIATPFGGYPVVRASNLTIDGYTQPGAVPNRNSIVQGNNAKLQIILDSRNGAFTQMNFEPDFPSDDTGFGDDETTVLGFHSGTGNAIRGLGILGQPFIETEAGVKKLYGISFAHGASGHINGCWLGVDVDGTTLAGLEKGVAGFRYRVREPDQPERPILVNDLIIGVGPNATDPRAELNVINGVSTIPIIIEGNRTRISGNYLNVFPSGVKDYNPALDADISAYFRRFEGSIEIGRGGNSTLIGTDGDGKNDADERNVIGGVVPPPKGYDHNIEFYGQTPGTNIVIAGNFIGIGANGSTRFTNGVPVLNAGGGSAEYRFGSDLNGVSDGLEANTVANNWPADLFVPSELGLSPARLSFFDELGVGGSVSARGNRLLNNFPFPVSPTQVVPNTSTLLLTNYYGKVYLDVEAGLVPVISTDSTSARLKGSVPAANPGYPTVVVDLYIADEEGIATGVAAAVPEFADGWFQGRTYLGSFVVDSAQDADSNPNSFDFDISRFGGGKLTITANYSAAPAGTAGAKFITSPFSSAVFVASIPNDAVSAGLTRIKEDKTIFELDRKGLGNWEPYAGVLGNSVFLIEGNRFAADSDTFQRYGVAFAKVDGADPVEGEGFYGDDGTPYLGQINLSRQNGNPGRVTGDKRPGATAFVVGGETSVDKFPAFQSDDRWTLGWDRLANGRYGTVQAYTLSTDLKQTPTSKAIDVANGRVTSGTAPDAQISRFGGDVAFLDNGNFVAMVEDKSKLRNPNGDAASAAIFRPDGSVVKDTFLVANGSIWGNLAAYKGGFCVRVSGVLYFYDNEGNLQGSISNVVTGGAFDDGRGDNTRLAAHINTPYVFLAGPASGIPTVRLAVFDSRDRSFVAIADVADAGIEGVARPDFDRANLAVDALGRVAVAYELVRPGNESTKTLRQTYLRVLAFDDVAKTLRPLTASVAAFANYDRTLEADAAPLIKTERPTVAMTTKEIMVAAKGITRKDPSLPLSLENVTLDETVVYTILSHPDPKNDPTPAVGGGVQPTISISKSGDNVVITFTGTLESKATVNGATWQAVAGAVSPLTLTPAQQSAGGFYRARQ